MSTDWLDDEVVDHAATEWLRQPESAEADLDFSEFMALLAGSSGGRVRMSLVEVPLQVFVAAQQGEYLYGLRILPDPQGFAFLLATLVVGDNRCNLISESFVGPSAVAGIDEDERLERLATLVQELTVDDLDEEVEDEV